MGKSVSPYVVLGSWPAGDVRKCGAKPAKAAPQAAVQKELQHLARPSRKPESAIATLDAKKPKRKTARRIAAKPYNAAGSLLLMLVKPGNRGAAGLARIFRRLSATVNIAAAAIVLQAGRRPGEMRTKAAQRDPAEQRRLERSRRAAA